VRDVPVDGFWSISLCNAEGYFIENAGNAYTLNSTTANKDQDGSVTVQFGGCVDRVTNCLPIMPGATASGLPSKRAMNYVLEREGGV
jgi:hypothetical protein